MLLASVQMLEVLGGKCVLVTMGKRDGGGAAPYHGYITSQKNLLFSHWKILGAGKYFTNTRMRMNIKAGSICFMVPINMRKMNHIHQPN